MAFFVRDKQFYRKLVAIAIPVALNNLIKFGVSMADTVMVGALGEVHLSAVALANQLTFVFILLIFGLGSGSSVMAAQHWGKGEVASIHKIMTLMYRFLLVGAGFFTCLALFAPETVMSIFTTDPATIELGAQYLRYVSASYIPLGIASATMIVLRAVSVVKVAVLVSSLSLVTSVFLNWVLIFGNLGAPALGVRGAAIATLIARILELVLILVYMIRFEKKICYRMRHFFTRKLGYMREYAFTALPVMLNELLWGLGSATLAIVIGRMGTAFTAAHSVCAVLGQLVTVIIFGVANSGTVVMGNTVGEGKYDLARQYAKTLTGISLLLGIISAGVVFLLRDPMISFFHNLSDVAKLYAVQIINVHIAVTFFQSLAGIGLLGVLRGGGDTRFVLICDVIFMWIVSIPLGFIAGLVLGWPVAVVYAIIKSDELLKSMATLFRVARGKWINDITLRPGMRTNDQA